VTYLPSLDMNGQPDLDMAPDLTPDQDPVVPDMPLPDMETDGSDCNLVGCPTLAEACNVLTGLCGPCVAGDPNIICRNGSECVGGTCACPENSNLCGDICVPRSAQSCTPACAQCPGILNGQATCEANACGGSCAVGNVLHNGNTCVTGGQTCGPAAPLGGSCDIVLQTGCNAEIELCSTVIRAGASCNNDGDCSLGQSCTDVPPGSPTRCIFFESGCSTALGAIDRCDNSSDCPAGMNCMAGGICGPCTTDSDCPAGQFCKAQACRGDYVADIPEGQSCQGGTQRCEPGLLCSGGFCKRLCETQTSAGCRPDQFCRPLQSGSGAGICESSC